MDTGAMGKGTYMMAWAVWQLWGQPYACATAHGQLQFEHACQGNTLQSRVC